MHEKTCSRGSNRPAATRPKPRLGAGDRTFTARDLVPLFGRRQDPPTPTASRADARPAGRIIQTVVLEQRDLMAAGQKPLALGLLRHGAASGAADRGCVPRRTGPSAGS